MWFQLISYIKFIIKSTNQHGVHSPFIYNFVTKCLYKKGSAYTEWKKAQQLQIKTIQYFNPKTVCFVHVENQQIIAFLKSNFTSITTFNLKDNITECTLNFDVIIIKHIPSSKIKITINNLINQVHNNSILIVENPYQSKDNYDLWAQLKQHHKTTVSVDCYTIGFIFFRKEQAKQDFYIRL